MSSTKANMCSCSPLGKIVTALVVAEAQKQSQAAKPVTYIRCNAAEGSYELHELYKDTVKKTQPDPEKMAHIQEKIDAFNLKRKLSNDLRQIKIEKASELDRRPSLLDHMHHGDEGEAVRPNN